MCIRDRSGDIVDSNYAKKLKNYANAENKELREIGITTVSYTHLDVYKRQIIDTITVSGKNLRRFFNVKFIYILKECLHDDEFHLSKLIFQI